MPHCQVHTYEQKYHLDVSDTGDRAVTITLKMGNEVWVKQHHIRCTAKSKKKKVTSVNSGIKVLVDGMP